MRELKFRVWDGHEMTNSDLLWLSLTGKLYEDRGSEGFVMMDGDCKVMQYTGLKDKNGVEIYESDIVTDGLCVSVVRFETEGFGSCGCCYDPFVGAGFMSAEVYLDKECEVIGSIHQNPELIP